MHVGDGAGSDGSGDGGGGGGGKYVATWIFVSLECNSLCTRPVMLAAWIYLYNSGEGELCVHVGDGGGGGGSGDGGDVGGGRGQHSQHLCVAEV